MNYETLFSVIPAPRPSEAFGEGGQAVHTQQVIVFNQVSPLLSATGNPD